jgi:H+/Cl- antiporter ClcA
MQLPIHWMWWPILGGLVAGLGGLIEPHALGVGYDNIARMLQGDTLPKAALLLLVAKAIIWPWRWAPARRAACWHRC